MFKNHKCEWDFSFKIILNRNYRRLHYTLMTDQHFLHSSCRQSVSSSVYYIVQSRHHIQIPVFIEIPCISTHIIPWTFRHVLINKSLIVIPQSTHKTRGQRLLYAHSTQYIRLLYLFIVLIKNLHIEPRHWLGTTSWFGFEGLQIDEIATDDPARLGLPIVVIN